MASRRRRTASAARRPSPRRRRSPDSACRPRSRSATSRPKSSSSFASSGATPARRQSSSKSISSTRSPSVAGRAPLALGGARVGQLVADHPQRQELVALQPQDRHAGARRRARRRGGSRRGVRCGLSSPSSSRKRIFEIEMSGNSLAQPPHDLADAQRPLRAAASCARRQPRCKLISAPPRTSSGTSRPEARRRSRARALSIRWRLTNVPFSEPWSSTKNEPSRSTSTAWLRETVTSSRKMSQSGERPIRVRSPAGRNASPALPPPERTTSAGPSSPSSGSCSCPSTSSAENDCGRLVRVALLEQRAAARAVVRRLRVQEPALGAIDVAHRPSPGELIPPASPCP